jgi:small subunit ribosomal protein S1
VTARVLEVDVERERISLGVKQATETGGGDVRKSEVVTVIVRSVTDGGLEVQMGDDGPMAFIKRSDLSRDRDEQRPERFQVGQKLDAMVVGFERGKRPMLSVKAMQIAEEKQQVAQYGSSDSGASLGDILGAALNKARDNN